MTENPSGQELAPPPDEADADLTHGDRFFPKENEKEENK
jgi:hypothetical protein